MVTTPIDKTVLIVDDDESVAKVIKITLQRHGFKDLPIAYSGEQALSFLGIPVPGHGVQFVKPKQSIDLIILDVFLPDISGFEVCDEIKKKFGRALPVLIITGFDIPEYVARGVEVGADDFLSKPIVPEELIARINILLQRHSMPVNSVSKSSASFEAPNFKEKNPLEGIEKIDHYRIENMLSWSASTMVYTVIDERTEKRYVLKRLLRQILEFPEVINRFHREIEIMKSMNHPNICGTYESGEVEGCPYCIIEYVDGDNLEIVLDRSGSLDMMTIHNVAYGVGRALKQVHHTGIIHRDIKLKNIYLCNDGTVKLSDFGVAIKIGETRLTQHGYAIGTPIYMAPEQFDGRQVTPVTDIYSYGATLYHLITGRAPFSADNVTHLMQKHLNESPVPFNEFRNDVPQGWNNLIVNHCLAKNPEDRPQSMNEVLNHLDNLKR